MPCDKASFESQIAAKRSEFVEIADRIISDEVGIIEGCRAIVDLIKGMDVSCLDGEFLVFVAVDSETDALPVGSERNGWDSQTLKTKDLEIQRAEKLYRETVIHACSKLLRRFAS